MLNTKLFKLKMVVPVLLCGAYAAASYAAPTPEVLRTNLLAGFPAGSQFYEQKTSLSEDGRFLLLRGSVYNSAIMIGHISKLIDLYSHRAIDLQAAYPSESANSISASGRFVSTNSGIIDVKWATVTNLGLNFVDANKPLSDNGRYLAHKIAAPGFLLHGYVYDRVTGQSILATPLYGTSSQMVPSTFNGYPNDLTISGDGKVLFWGTDGINAGFAPAKPGMRDLIAHNWFTASTVNPRVSNCNNCNDAQTTKGSGAYEYDVSSNGNVAVFRSPEDFGFVTAAGLPRNGASQIYARNLTTLKVDLISGDDAGKIEDISPATNTSYYEPSISSDGRFVVYSGDSKTYIRDRFAKKKQVLDTASGGAIISGNGKSILLQKNDGWYTLANPYLVTATDFTSNYLFANIVVNSAARIYDHMLLTANNTWTGYIDYSGSGASSILIEMDGTWNGSGDYIAGGPSPLGYGDNNADGVGDFGDFNSAIPLAQGAGRYKVTFNDQAFQYTVKKLANVNFNCYNGTTTLGQSVYVTGNIPELGDWSPANAVKLNPTSYPTWTGALELPTNTNIEWKCIKRDELNPATSLVWESGANNQFNPSSAQTTDGHF